MREIEPLKWQSAASMCGNFLDLLFRDLIEKRVSHMLSSLNIIFDTHGHLFI